MSLATTTFSTNHPGDIGGLTVIGVVGDPRVTL